MEEPRIKFITAFNGARDSYMLPLALYEAGLLERHLSDFYLPSRLSSRTNFLAEGLRARNNRELPFSMVSLVGSAVIPNLMSRVFKNYEPNYLRIDEVFGRAALRMQQRTGAHLFLHNGYAMHVFEALGGMGVIRCLFQYHPHPLSCLEILLADYAKYPEMKWSVSYELGNILELNRAQREQLDIEWRNADRIYTASTFSKRTLLSQGCDPRKIVVCPYGVPAVRYRGINRANESKICTFLFVGQAVQRKGIHHLLIAWKNARLNNSRLLIVSRVVDPGLAGLLDQKNVILRSGISSAELAAIYAASDVFVMPSLAEGFGLVFLEAFANGLYCIGTANTGLPDITSLRDFSSIVEVGNVAMLSEELENLERIWRKGGIDRDRIASLAINYSWNAHRRKIVNDLKDWLECTPSSQRSETLVSVAQ